ncbi:MAG TPA: hypothetical protein VLL27_09630 [Solirubrobacterales bacterium]|nr:hypothetical protein [Solirubrobacterales bacterium]
MGDFKSALTLLFDDEQLTAGELKNLHELLLPDLVQLKLAPMEEFVRFDRGDWHLGLKNRIHSYSTHLCSVRHLGLGANRGDALGHHAATVAKNPKVVGK